MGKRDRHGVNIPGALMDQIRESGRYDDDERFKRQKRKISRKERRKEQREQKKRKRGGDKEERAIMDRLKKVKGARDIEKEGKQQKKNSTLKIVKEEELEADDSDLNESEEVEYEEFTGFDDEEEIEEEESDNDSDESLDDEQKDVMAQLMKLKGAKKGSNVKIVKEDELQDEVDELEGDTSSEEEFHELEDESHTESEVSGDEATFPKVFDKTDDDLEYYAKKLGIKKNSKLKKTDEHDIIGGLLDGLEFDGSGSEEEEEEEEEDSTTDSLDEEDRELLKEMGELETSESDSDSDAGPSVRENPYVAPVPAGKYVPPALRRKLLENDDSEEMQKIIRSVKGPFNKLSEANLLTVVNDLSALYTENARQIVNEAIIKVVFQSVLVSTPMLDSFLVLYATVIVALYRLQGVEFGAYAIQTLVEKLCEYIKTESSNKEASNLIALIAFCYELNLLSSRLMYDVIGQKLIDSPTEFRTELLLKVIRSCGSKLRSDDPSSLKEIVLTLNKNVGSDMSTRSKFLIETVSNLKNNKLKHLENEATSGLVTRLKKQLGRIRSVDPIKVSLSDIENINEKGKWWLVGSAWKGDEKKVEESTKSVIDALDKSEPNWLELAKQHRMNTDIRRAIFISIMSASDYMDAYVKLEKLRLKKTQQREIPRILMHCASIETVFNPYYAFVAKKLCEDHAMRKTFQFNLWDLLKELEGEEYEELEETPDEDEKLKKTLNLGRLFGTLVGEGSLPLNVLRTVNFLTASEDTKLFVEIFMISFFDSVGKLSEQKIFGAGDKKHKTEDMRYNDKTMVERINKCKEQPTLLRGLQYFLQHKVRDSTFIKGKKQRSRVHWGVDSMSDIVGELFA
ncbi:hypothetical protein KL918_004627 [Ogataea parapolymorpha]|uniref:Nucleolar MIF4G domain-containing protein 1 n=1 Tax=Ogataea parapolymorpha (strain ATCC 26012 / BCRC 20466 / JCM 22074 / NRRL Y-7560 / DL-1) TaxID=871575 RepID=W1QLA8_OGAPD|nr:Nucleolar MIF4G domain-containing protein 1 [Ogataea parapolymorpha DL-1]ESX03581.1 Nucleolar MIF4G domain-containing protein 1 [Ogataea parapolymorpha DL-1]KAG7865385.1 hypothetical protein KL918_004627 [Ogataea parapolymorpha]KAG7873830.1 hypothetical protein KL916_001990 [Ogataea parapolymorpha]